MKQKSNLGHWTLWKRLSSDTGNAMNEWAVIVVNCKSGTVCSVSCTCSHGNHNECTWRLDYCSVVFKTLFFQSFMHNLPNIWRLNQNSKNASVQVKTFSSTCQKSQLFETICNLQVVWKIGHVLHVLCPCLEIYQRVALVISASLKYSIDYFL